MVNFKIKIANKVIEINAFYESTKKYCLDFLSDEESDYKLTLTKEDLENEAANAKNGQVYVDEEISALYRKIADLLIEDNIIVFHGSSFKVDEKGFIIAAHSGIGKSTHCNLLNEYLNDKFVYINDDKPLLEVKDNNITIYSTPWNGKERRGNNIEAPLKAIIFLNRGLTNSYKELDNKDGIYINLLNQIYLPKEKKKREKALKVIDVILKSMHFYAIYVNKDLDSAKMTYERIIKNEIK